MQTALVGKQKGSGFSPYDLGWAYGVSCQPKVSNIQSNASVQTDLGLGKEVWSKDSSVWLQGLGFGI